MNVDFGRLMATREDPGDYVGSDGLLYHHPSGRKRKPRREVI